MMGIALIILLASCKSQVSNNEISTDDIKEIVAKVKDLSNIRYYGYDDGVIDSVVSDKQLESVKRAFKTEFDNQSDNFLELESYISNIENMLEVSKEQSESIDEEITGQYVMDENGEMVWEEFGGTTQVDYDSLYLDDVVEIKNGNRGVYRDKLKYNNGTAYVIVYDTAYKVYEEDIEYNINKLVGDRKYLLDVISYNYFDNGILIIELETAKLDSEEVVPDSLRYTVVVEVENEEKVIITDIKQFTGDINT